MKPSVASITKLRREVQSPVSDCRDALAAASCSHDGALVILKHWAAGQLGPNGEIPSSWRDASIQSRQCPKCYNQFDAIPDTATCTNCQYTFRASSSEHPNYFPGFVRQPSGDLAALLTATQLEAVRQVLNHLASYGDAGESAIIQDFAATIGTSSGPTIGNMLCNISSVKLQALGGLIIALGTGRDAVEAWLTEWKPGRRVTIACTRVRELSGIEVENHSRVPGDA